MPSPDASRERSGLAAGDGKVGAPAPVQAAAWWGSRRVFAASRSRRRQAAKKLDGGEAPPPGPGTGAGKVFLLHRKVQAEHRSEPSP